MDQFETVGTKNPKIIAVDSEAVLKYYLTRKDLSDYELFCQFINKVKSTVRHDLRYTNYKSELYKIGLDKCQFHHGINSEMAPIEMHHGPIFSMFDICTIVTDHLLAEEKLVNSFIVANKVLIEHEKHHIQLVMLCETCHEAAENGSIFVSFKQGFGQLEKFLKKYKKGVSKEHIGIIKEYLDLSKTFSATDNGIYEILDLVKKYVKK